MADSEERSAEVRRRSFAYRLWDLVTAIAHLIYLFITGNEIVEQVPKTEEHRMLLEAAEAVQTQETLITDEQNKQLAAKNQEGITGVSASEAPNASASEQQHSINGCDAVNHETKERECRDASACERSGECPPRNSTPDRELGNRREVERQIENDEAFARALIEAENDEAIAQALRESDEFDTVGEISERIRNILEATSPMLQDVLQNGVIVRAERKKKPGSNSREEIIIVAESDSRNANNSEKAHASDDPSLSKQKAAAEKAEVDRGPANVGCDAMNHEPKLKECRDASDCERSGECPRRNSAPDRDFEKLREPKRQIKNDEGVARALDRFEDFELDRFEDFINEVDIPEEFRNFIKAHPPKRILQDALQGEVIVGAERKGKPGAQDRKNITVVFSSDSGNADISEKAHASDLAGAQGPCKICMDKQVEVEFKPCKHIICCEDCARVLEKCPTCKREIEDWTHIL